MKYIFLSNGIVYSGPGTATTSLINYIETRLSAEALNTTIDYQVLAINSYSKYDDIEGIANANTREELAHQLMGMGGGAIAETLGLLSGMSPAGAAAFGFAFGKAYENYSRGAKKFWDDFWRDPNALDPASQTAYRKSMRDMTSKIVVDGRQCIDPAANTNFLAAPKAAPLRRDPLILDLDNDGLETVGIDTARPILFDHTGTGLKTASGWVKPDDAFLVIDRNGNGRIDSGRELFGDATPLDAGGSAADGFAALAQEDSNHDGQVTAADARWADLRLWRDLNQDGLTQGDELSTLSDHGITALNVAKTSHSTLLDNGNQIADLGGFLRADGRIGTLGEVEQLEQLADINLISNPFYSEFTDAIPLTEGAQRLPDMQGSGKVRDLRQAASLQTPAGQALAAALDAFAAAPTRSEQMHQLDGLLKAWAETSTMATTASGAFAGVDLSLTFAGVAPDSPAWQAWMDKLSILERFNGQTFLPVPAAGTTLAIDFYSTREALLDAAYTALKDSVYGALVLQTRLKPYLDAVSLTIDESGIKLDFSGVEAAMDTLHASDPANALIDRVELLRYAGDRLLQSGWKGTEKIEQWIGLAEQNGTLEALRNSVGLAFASSRHDFHLTGSLGGLYGAGAGDDAVLGASGNDVLFGEDGADFLMGGVGDDTIYGRTGNDVLIGASGNDFLQGDAGSDTYVFQRGGGHDTIAAIDWSAGHVETLVLEGLNVSDVQVEKQGTNDLVFVIKDTGESIKVQSFFSHDANNSNVNMIDVVKFADGTTWDRAMLLNTFGVYGTPGNDRLTGADGVSNRMYGKEGNDYLGGVSGNDILDGGAGDDTLYGSSGNDTLDGGAGNDLLSGEGGNDSYLFRRGSGSDTIWNYDSTPGRVDTLILEGLNASDIRLEKQGTSDLVFVIKDTGESIKVQSFFSSDAFKIDAVKFADGTTWDRATLLNTFGVYGTPGNDRLTGADGVGNRMYGNEGNDYLGGSSGNDMLDGGVGNDTLYGGAGNDTLDGGTGTDMLSGDAGSNTYLFRRGSGVDTIGVSGSTPGRLETLILEGLNASDIRLEKQGTSDLVFVIKDTGESIKVQGFFSSDAFKIDTVKFADGTTWDRATLLNTFGVYGTPGNDRLTGADGVGNRMYGKDGNDFLGGSSGNDIMDGGVGNDTLYGGAGNDTLDGGEGDDTLSGDAGSNTYLFRRGGGVDTINVSGSTSGRLETLILEGLNASDIRLEKQGTSDLVFVIKDTGESIKVQGFFSSDAFKIDTVKFADGTRWDRTTLLNTFGVYGTPGHDRLTGADGVGNRMYGNEGNDYLGGSTQADYLDGGEGNDSLSGSDGNDTLDGGAGNDTLSGEAGSNTYFFRRGSGADTINVSRPIAGRIETLVLENLNPEDIRIEKPGGSDLALVITDTGESITVQSFFSSDSYKIDAVKFADGTTWDRSMLVDNVGAYGTSGNDVLSGSDARPHRFYGYAGNDYIAGGSQDDVLNGGEGNDALNGGTGNDTLYGGAGDDSYEFRKGDGVDAISEGEGAASGSADTVRFLDVKSTEVSAVRQGSTLVLDYGTTDQLVIDGQFADGASAIERISFSDGVVWDLAAIQAHVSVYGSDGHDALNGLAVDDRMYGLDGNDSLSGDAGNDLLDGGAGQDTLHAGAGNDTLYGGPGNDLLYGGSGDDSYVFSKGDGIDSITEGEAAGGGSADTVRFLDVASSEVSVVRNGDALVLSYGTAGQLSNQLTIDGQFAGGASAIEHISFSDGVVWDQAGIEANLRANDSAGDELPGGLAEDARGAALDSDVSLIGDRGDNLLDGGAGQDTLYGGAGNDTLSGGRGNDLLYGGRGNDSYVFSKGDGVDSISEGFVTGYGPGGGALDTVRFLDVTSSEVNAWRRGTALVLDYGAGDQLTLDGQFAGGANAIERITFSDGVSWNKAAIRAHAALLGTAADDVLRGGRRADRIYGLDGNDALYGKAGKDLLDGGAGNDSLYGGAGNDILDGGAGDDSLSDTAGKAVFNGGAGNDTLSGGSRAELYLGGQGNDTCTTGGGKDVILFNKGDGQDSVAASSLNGDTLSLGGDFAYSDLGLRKSGNDLVLSLGERDQITFQDWYARRSSRPALKLQVIAEAMAGFAAGGSDPLLDQKVENFNFSGLVKAFDAARTAPALNAWSLNDALLKFQLAGSDAAAVGGDLAYQYGKNGSVSGLSLTATQELINDSHFGRHVQALQPLAELTSAALKMA